MANMMELIKMIALDAYDASKPSQMVVGQVTSTTPLKIKVSDKLTLTGDNVLVPESFTDHFEYMDLGIKLEDIEITSMDPLVVINPITIDLTGKKKIKVYNALRQGEKVLLLRNPGGQIFYLIDRVVRVYDPD